MFFFPVGFKGNLALLEIYIYIYIYIPGDVSANGGFWKEVLGALAKAAHERLAEKIPTGKSLRCIPKG